MEAFDERMHSDSHQYYPVGYGGIHVDVASFFVTNSHHSQKFQSGQAQFVTAYYDTDQAVSEVPAGAWVFNANRINLRFTALDPY
jgi:hypothetical protein